MSTQAPVIDRRSRVLLIFCMVAVAFAAIDTYVVVLALPDMMKSVDISPDALQRAAPIISGFLLGYVAVLPLIGRIADLRGPVPVLAGSLVAFTIGSVVTTVSFDLTSLVVGRFLQGVGGGGLVPATLALVAAIYPVEQRGVPLGLVSAVQEFGSVLGPLFGAAVLALTSWQGIFAINAAAGVLLWVVVRGLGAAAPDDAAVAGPPSSRYRFVGRIAATVLGSMSFLAAFVTVYPVRSIQQDLTYGELYVPVVSGAGRWLTPLGLTALVLLLVATVVGAVAFDVRGSLRRLDDVDFAGATYLAVALGGIVLAFATADPQVSVFSAQGPWFLFGSGVATISLVIHLRKASNPLVPVGTLRAMPAWGSLVVSLLVGWALIAALVDIPLLARTQQGRTQFEAALFLLRFLVALPVGAVAGGWLLRHLPAGVITAIGMLLAAGSFQWMSGWDADSLDAAVSNVPLVLGGLGFGLALAPVNAAMLASTRQDTHGLASALVVTARMIGMLVGISVLTTWGLRRLAQAIQDDPSLQDNLRGAAVLQEQSVFQGAAVFAFVAAVLALVVFRGANTRGVKAGQVLGPAG